MCFYWPSLCAFHSGCTWERAACVPLANHSRHPNPIPSPLYNQSVCVSANLDVILSVQSLDETGETAKEAICCSSLEGGWGRERRRWERISFSVASNQQWYQPEFIKSIFCQVLSCICSDNVQQLIIVLMLLIHYYITDKSMTISSEVLQQECNLIIFLYIAISVPCFNGTTIASFIYIMVFWPALCSVWINDVKKKISYSLQTEAHPQLSNCIINVVSFRQKLRIPGTQRESTVSV